MRAELKQEFTRRVTNANKSELVVILYDMFHQDVIDAEKYCNEGNYAEMKVEIKRSRAIISELINSLDRQYEIAGNLYNIYRYVERQLIESEVRRDVKGLEVADRLMSKLSESFRQVAALDTDGPLMVNAEPVYAGMTYGKNNLNESSISLNRGVLA